MEEQQRARRPNPREAAGPFSALLFWWTVPLFREGYRHALQPEDLCEPRPQDRSRLLGDALERAWKSRLRLLPALGAAFACEYLYLGALVVVSDIVCRLAQPQLLGGLLVYFKPHSDVPREHAFAYAAGIVACTALSALCSNHYILGAFHVGMRVRAACCTLIYRKSLRLSQTALGQTAAGQVVNLLSNDVSRFDMVSIFLHYMWAAPLAAVITAYFMYREVGWPAFAGIAAVFVVVPLQAYTGHLSAIYRHKTAIKTDERVRLMDEIVSGIQVIKMYAWEKPFSQLVTLARKLEIKVVKKTSYIRGLYMTFGLSTTRIALMCTLITMVLVKQPLTADKVFVVLSYFNILSHTMSMMFVRGVAEVAEALVSIRRLEDFMSHEELAEAKGAGTGAGAGVDNPAAETGDDSDSEAEGAPALELEALTARWNPEATGDPTLADVNLRAGSGSLVAVIGQVGAGKSSLLQVLLGELPAAAGRLRVRGRVSYAAQQPWVFAATVRQNILFGRPYERRRYERVVRACALTRDFQELPQGDLTIVGQRGASLSGGQKARINLARAVYHDADVYLLDDPLSAVDAHVSKHLFDDCVCGLLAGKTRVLVTHQLQYLKKADLIVLLNNGRVELQGGFHAVASAVEYAQLLGGGEAAEPADEQPEAEREPAPTLHRLLRQISTQSKSSVDERSATPEPEGLKAEPPEDQEDEEARAAKAEHVEGSSKGRTKGKSVYFEYFRAGTSGAGGLVLVLLYALTQVAVSSVDWFVSYWTNQEETRALLLNRVTAFALATATALNGSVILDEADNSTDPALADLLDLPLPLQAPELSALTYAYIFVGMVVGLFALALVRSIAFYSVAMRCSERLHAAIFRSIIRTRMRFFDVNPSGRILNRFSKDMGAVDELLPKAILDAGQIILLMVGCIIVSFTVNYLFIVPIAVMGAIFWMDRTVYLKTSKNVKRVEGIVKSPVFSHLHATLQGLTTIRAYGAQDTLRDEFDKHQDLHSSACYMFLATSTAFGFSLDALVLVYIALVTFSFLVFEELLGGQVGLAITQSMSLTGMIQWGMRQSAEVANNMMSVERLLEYSVLDPEPGLDSPPAKPPPPGWPRAGELRFEAVSLSYSETAKPVLQDLTLHVLPGEKVGVVGRTGAGKSSLIAALFRLSWRIDGRVLIDGVDTRELALPALRARLSIIPQDPVLFSGTLRRNLDPFDEFPDYKLWHAIEEVELRDALSDGAGLETSVAEGGANFSVGQRQLVCLARAILRNNRVLVLDEATANVDPHTDALIQRTIRSKFQQCTVLTVAHRLNTIMDSDKVLVMSAGSMVEYDHPHVLLQNKNGHLYSLVQETGRSMAEQLARMAEECYLNKVNQGELSLR